MAVGVFKYEKGYLALRRLRGGGSGQWAVRRQRSLVPCSPASAAWSSRRFSTSLAVILPLCVLSAAVYLFQALI